MTTETFTQDRPGFEASKFADDRTAFPCTEAAGPSEHEDPADEDEDDALCRDALARFADALRKAVLD